MSVADVSLNSVYGKLSFVWVGGGNELVDGGGSGTTSESFCLINDDVGKQMVHCCTCFHEAFKGSPERPDEVNVEGWGIQGG